jgi:hypothetical protein
MCGAIRMIDGAGRISPRVTALSAAGGFPSENKALIGRIIRRRLRFIHLPELHAW